MHTSGRLWPRADLRVGDADRQAVVAELQRHFVDGRLSTDELDERVAQALAARTFGDLAVPVADLPVLDTRRATQIEAQPEEGSDFNTGPALGALMVMIGVFALVSMLVFPAMHLGPMGFWPICVVGLFFIGRPRRGRRRTRWHRGDPPTRYL